MTPKSKSVRIAILLCDTPIPAIAKSQGDYYAIFDKLLRESHPATHARDDPRLFVLDGYDVVKERRYPKHEDGEYDAVIITGSVASAYDDSEWVKQLIAYTATLARTKPHVKLVGICFGHQIIACALNGTCVPNGGKWEVGVSQVRLTDLGKEIFGLETLNIHQMHRDHVPTVPESFHLLGSTPISYNQGMIRYLPTTGAVPTRRPLTDIQILTTQGHPEFTDFISTTLISYRASTPGTSLDKETAKAGLVTARGSHDGVKVVGRVIWGILGVTDF